MGNNRFKQTLFVSLFFIVQAANVTWARADDLCQTVFQETVPKDQCQAEECYLFAFLGHLEERNANRRNIPNGPTFSGGYLFAAKIQSWIRDAVWYGPKSADTFYPLEGGFIHTAIQMVHQHGLVPDSEFHPTVPYSAWPFKTIYEHLNTRAAELAQYVGLIRAQRGSTAPETVQAYRDSVAELTNYIEQYSGKLPTLVQWEGQTVTPADLWKKYGAESEMDVWVDYPKDGWAEGDWSFFKKRMDQATEKFFDGWFANPRSDQEIVQRIIQYVEAKEPLLIELKWGDDLREAHMLVIDGIERNAAGLLTRIRLKNSWGPNWGDHGSKWYEWSWISPRLRAVIYYGAQAK